jgi:D-alanine-D-alanine ligase
MAKKTIALISGGISSEREVSLNSGKQVDEALDKNKYRVQHYDPKTDLPKIVADAGAIDAALIILHGPFGEDGTIQGMLDLLNIPYQGSGVLGSAVAMDKVISKKLYEKAGIPVPPYVVLNRGDRVDPARVLERLAPPMVIKPASGGSSIGMSIVSEADQLPVALKLAFAEDEVIIAEKYLKGVELTGGVLGNDSLQALPLIEIVPDKAFTFFDYQAKYTPGATEEICPARIDPALTEKAQSYALAAHQALCCRGYSRTDMIAVERDLFVLETNTIPGMTATSLYPQAAAAAGITFGPLMDRLIELALEDHERRNIERNS